MSMITAPTFAPRVAAAAHFSAPTSIDVDRHSARAPAPDSGAPVLGHWLAAALDELDYGIVLLQPDMSVVHVNDAARAELDDGHPLQRVGRELRPRLGRDAAPLLEAITAAAQRGLRRLVTLGKDADRTSVSVVPLEGAPGEGRTVLVVLGKRAVCETLSIEGYARSFGLTGAETRVLVELCKGIPPAEIASELGVAISTVRSQIGSVRLKTGASSIRALVRQIAVLPPVKGLLRKEREPAMPAWMTAATAR
jgi:DNA-binding CsgD family transcriptional regulator